MGAWRLLLKKEKNKIVTVKKLKVNSYEEAYTYFRLKENLNLKEFDELFIVERIFISPKDYKWWEEESFNLDIEKD